MENLKNIAPVEDFNWEAYENGESFAGASHEDLEKAYDSTLNKVNDREVVDGTVIAMNKREVVVNIGYKSDGIIPLNELHNIYNNENDHARFRHSSGSYKNGSFGKRVPKTQRLI